jgi:polysaccharide pyruvyl transferase WcaK-like protein
VVIGGGNLLSDHDLNFPTKLALALHVAAERDLPVVIYACGMAEHWTAEGDRRLRRALAQHRPRAVFLRDQASCDRWNARFVEVSGQTAQVVRDPGLLAVDTYCAVARPNEGPVIGLGIMSHVAIRYHAQASQSSSDLAAWYVALARALTAQGATVIGFTNGAPEDRAAADEIAAPLGALGVEIRQPATPADLSGIVGGCHAIAAYRMHAVIAAYAHGVPALALRWDGKLDAFMASVGRADWMADPAALPADAAAERLMAAARAGLSAQDVARVLDETRAGVARALSAIAAG